MKALVSTEYQPLDRISLAERPKPAAGPGQVLVKVSAAALNPLDLALITGAMKDFYPVDHPLVVGMDVAGTVTEVGPDAAGYAPGDQVLAFVPSGGTVAEYTVATVGPRLARRPAGLDAEHGAAIPESGMTAVCLLRAVGLGADESLLVIGATGGIGLYAVQLATALGARVIATAAADDAGYVRELGATDTVDHRAGDVVEQTLRLVPGGVDVVLDLINRGEGLADTARAARPGGRLVSPLFGPAELEREVTPVYIGSFDPAPGDLEDLAHRAADGRLRVELGARYPFDRAVDAVADFAGKHTRGKIVITVDGS
ncbi:NADPH:quinone reductase [Kitasatospora herbaricolor]|uniref:NADP-dependent oxidoreductase n=1 Tax=Kitasatospora herbaricolor TaxID=68217 RepID=UPI00174B897C|nr:NADP-dependent oxidoreductase [Kitasatospora herbaricolor]MDQ0306282.1 NADPH:quinone reductase-like Zn-dependent oxidoreductase [Kitasatospora herbaricolor]GGV42900.1 NADPH:quinone reductase [Kitasatospora herbaricolor]